MIFKLRQNIFSWFRENYEIVDETDTPRYSIRSKVTLLRKFKITDLAGNTIFNIEKRYFRYYARYDIKNANDELLFYTKRLPTFFIRKMKVCSPDRKKVYRIKGDVFGWNFEITDLERNVVANISKKLFRLSDTYGVEVLDENQTELLLTVALICDTVYHRPRGRFRFWRFK